MEATNDQMVGVRGDKIVVVLPKTEMTREEAVRHACWLLVLAGLDRSYVARQILTIEAT